ncbi:MAG: U32 family peptidase, partial [Lachnospiraceae bacterium]|nr:U32 family peptidase [Lachnospiraceae bacterium]
ILPELVEARIDSFKIEGRMKSPAYVYGVTGIYRKYLDLCLANGGRGYRVEDKDLEILQQLYLRTEISTGYYHKLHGRDMMTIKQPGYNDTNEALVDMLLKEMEANRPLVTVNGSITLIPGEPAVLTVQARGKEVTVSGDRVEIAQSRPMAEEEILKRIGKMGGTLFKPGSFTVKSQGNVFLPVSSLNNLRRDALEQLEKELCSNLALKQEI